MKRGIASLIATVLMILITIAAVGVITQAVMPVIKDNLQTANTCGTTKLAIDLENGFSVYDSSTNVLSISISRGSETVELAGIQIKITDLSGQSKIAEVIQGGNYSFIDSTQMPEINSVKVYNINVSLLNMTYVSKASVAPIIRVGKTEKVCGIDSGQIEIPKSSEAISFIPETPQPSLGSIDWNNSLVGYWSLNEISGNVAYGYSISTPAAGYPGTVTGATWTTGKLGNGLLINGGQYVSIADNTLIQYMAPKTFTFWINPVSLSGTQNLIYRYYGVDIRLNDNKLYTNRVAGCCPTFTWGSSILNVSTGNWQFIAITENSSDATFFINGVWAGNVIGSYMMSGGPPMYFGGYNNGFNGAMDEMGIWGRELNSTEIAYLYNNGNGRSFHQ